jgi:hypothetical protein
VKRTVLAASGVYTTALMSDVTHIVAKAAGSEKHRMMSRPPHLGRVAVVGLGWVAALRGYEGTEPPPSAPHLLPPLTGFIVSLTGFLPADRPGVKVLVESSGAKFCGGLTISCSHLVAASPEGKKYVFAKQRGIKTVSLAWLRQCVENKALLDEADFPVPGTAQPQLSPSDRHPVAYTGLPGLEEAGGAAGTGAETVKLDRTAANAGNKVDATKEEPTPCEELAHITASLALESCCLFIVPGTQEADPEMRRRRARIMRLAALTSAMVSPRWSPAVTHAIVLSVPVAAPQVAEMCQAAARAVSIVDADWIRHSASAGSLLAPADYPPPSWSAAAPLSSVFYNGAEGVAQLTRDNCSTLGGRNSRAGIGCTSQIFQGVRLALGPLAMQAPDLCSSLSSMVLAGRGKVLTHDGNGHVASGVPTHVLCPAGLSAGELALVDAIRENNAHVELVTRVWIEECVKEQRLLATGSCSLFSAREYELPLSDFKSRKVVIAISGCQSVPPNPNRNRRRAVLSQLATALGAKYSEKMKRVSCTHLVVESTCTEMSQKVQCAQKWNVPIVSEAWLPACFERGAFVAVDPYLIRFPSPSAPLQEGFNLNSGIEAAAASRIGSKVTPLPPQQADRKRPSDGAPDQKTPRRKSLRLSSPDPAAAEALMKQLAASLVKATDANAATSSGAALAGAENDSRSASISDGKGDFPLPRGSRPGSNGNTLDENAVRNGGENDGTHCLLREKASAGASLGMFEREDMPPRRSEWSLEASQSQMIIHKDLTPPPAAHVEPKPIPRLRTMPSRASKTCP